MATSGLSAADDGEPDAGAELDGAGEPEGAGDAEPVELEPVTWPASTDSAIASPSAVPPPALRLSSAAWSATRSVVGGTTTRALVENATRPILKAAGTWSAKSEAAFWAAPRRVGSTSVAFIEPDTSIVRMIVASSRGTATTIDGRARAKTSAAMAPR